MGAPVAGGGDFQQHPPKSDTLSKNIIEYRAP